MSVTSDITIEAARAAPPVAVSGLVILDIPVEQWITGMTFLYLLLAIGLLIPKYGKIVKDWFDTRRAAKKEAKSNEPQA